MSTDTTSTTTTTIDINKSMPKEVPTNVIKENTVLNQLYGKD